MTKMVKEITLRTAALKSLAISVFVLIANRLVGIVEHFTRSLEPVSAVGIFREIVEQVADPKLLFLDFVIGFVAVLGAYLLIERWFKRN